MFRDGPWQIYGRAVCLPGRCVSCRLVAQLIVSSLTFIGFRFLIPTDQRGRPVSQHRLQQPERSQGN